MKHVAVFNTFMKDTVNLNQSRINILERRVDTITKFLKNSDLLEDNYLDARPQGSWAVETIIKPRPGGEFDADLRLYLKEFEGWEPKDYINNIYRLFKNTETYKEIVERKNRCIRLNYAGDFHLDIVPCLETQSKYFVFNRIENIMESTDGDGYTDWFREKDNIVGGKLLVKVTRLVKYLRDIKGTFTAKSVLLATLLGNQIYAIESEEEFKDLPTALCTICNRLNNFLQDNPDMPTVKNPALSDEDFNRHWDQDKYETFRRNWAVYTNKMNNALDEVVPDESIKKWRLVFGDAFGEISESKQRNIEIVSSPPAPWSTI